MEQLKRLFNSLSLVQRITLLLAAPLIVFGVMQLSHWNKQRDLKPLYQGVSAEDAGGILAKLKESGVEYQVAENGSAILVPSDRVAELRLQLAAAGLPKTGRIGFELFDKTNVMTSDFAEQVNYRRALEGELERSIATLSEIQQARVHLTMAKDSVYTESKQPAKASVLLQLKPTVAVSPGNVVAIANLIASAVEGLLPENVSILDNRGNLLSHPKRAQAAETEDSEAAIEYRQKIERDLLSKINSTLEPLLGSDRFRAGVFVDCDFSSGEQSEETFDPNSSVMTTAQRSEDTSGSTVASGVPGSSSNLPRPVSRPGSGQLGITRRTENISYQTSRSIKRMKLPQGNIRRMSVSVLVDHRIRWDGTGPKAKRFIEPLPPEKLKAIREVVAGITGFVAERGDQLVVETLAFDATVMNDVNPNAAPTTLNPQTPPGYLLQLPKFLQDPKILAIVAVSAIVLIVILVGAVFAMFRKRSKPKATTVPAVEGHAPAAVKEILSPEAAAGAPLRTVEEQIAGHTAEKERQLAEAMEQLQLPMVKTKKAEALAKHIGAEAKKNPEVIAHLVRSWLSEEQL